MFCAKCGHENTDGIKCCVNCGEELPVAVPVNGEVPVAQETKLGWAKFLGYFGLWVGAITNLGGAVSCLTGAQYGGSAQTVYAVFPALKGVDVIYGLLCVALAVFGVICALSIIKRKKSAITFVPMMYAIVGCVVLVYTTLATIIIKNSCFNTQTITNICMNVVMVFVNTTYFKNRAHIFVN